ncbi:MAG TPA: histidine phosphatase family protein [Solirubrobacteraceae bacterium]|nr:histidine phosphatase family protein [Solirubrobacteraceae bacterium]
MADHHPRTQEVWLVRHAETEWSRSGRHTGRTDVPLTDAGRERARELGARLRDRSFELVLVSPLERARETAALAGVGDGAQVREDLLEWDYGEYEGVTTRQIRETRPGWFLWSDGVPGGETAEEVAARCDRVVEEILGVDGDVAVFAHGHVLRALGARWLEEPVSFGGRLYLSTGSLSMLGFEREVRVIRLWNDS